MNVVAERTQGARGVPSLSDSSQLRPAHWAYENRRLIDIAVAVAVFFLDSMFLTGMYVWGQFPLPVFVVALALSVSICVLYVMRRRSLPVVFLCILILATVGVFVTGIGLSLAPVLVLGLMIYALGTQSGWRIAVAAVIAACVWVGVAGVPVVQDDRARVGEIGMLMLGYVLAVLIGMLTRSRRARFEALQERTAQLARERDAQALIAAAEERARIAREMHDIVSHSLGTMVVMADGAAQTVEADPRQAGQAMERVRDTGREAMTEMRRMLNVLRDESAATRAPQPGLAQLDRLIEETRSTGLRVDLILAGVPTALSPGVDLAAYRIVQEALTNARKHGGRLLSLITVTVSYLESVVELRVADDGREPGSAARTVSGSGHGLVGMRERVTAYGGTLETGPRPGGGFEVHATLPTGGQG